MSQDLNIEIDQSQNVWTGNLYYRMPRREGWVTSRGKSVESDYEKCERKFQTMVESNQDNIAPNVTFQDVLIALLPNGRQATFYVSRASLDFRQDYECRSFCTLGENRSMCAMLHERLPILTLRTLCDLPSLEALFPGNKTLAFRAHLNGCPQHGCALEIQDILWVSKREKMPFEKEIHVNVHLEQPGVAQPGNLFQTGFLQKLPIISRETQDQLTKFDNYLVWSTRLSQAQKGGLRYTSYEVNKEKKEVTFAVLSENQESYRRLQIRRNAEDIEIVPLGSSSDPWNFKMIEQKGHSVRNRNIPLGECRNVNEPKPKNPAQYEECPWKDPVGTTITFELTEMQIERIQHEDLFPEEGFLCKSTYGTETLNRRLRRGIDQLGRTGSEGTPWLAYYLNDIKNAQAPTPEEMAQPIEFFNKNLNDDQKRAVEVTLRAPEIALIQGPPGTGKTTVAGEIARQCVANHQRVLVVSQSSAAVDNMLDRLPLEPGLRVYRITSKFQEQREKDEPSRYSQEKVVETFCKSLQIGPKLRLDNWKTLEEQNSQISLVEGNLQNIQSRITLELDRLRQAQEERNRLQVELQQMERQQNQNLIQNAIREAAKRFMTCLRENRFEDLEDGQELADFVYRGFEEIVYPALNEFQKVEIGFGTLYDPGWSANWKTTSIIQKLRDFSDFQTRKLAKIREDYEKLQQLGSNEVVLSENALKLHEIEKRIRELDNEWEQALEEGSEKVGEIEREQRQLRLQKRKLNQNTGLSSDVYKDIFNLPQTTAEGGIAESLTAPGLSRADLLSRFKNLLELLDSLNERANSALGQFAADCEEHLAEMPVLPTLEKETARLNRQIEIQNEKIASINEMWSNYLKPQAGKAVAALNEQFHTSFQRLEEALTWCHETVEQNQTMLQNSAGVRSFLEPFFKDCIRILANSEPTPNESIQEKYIQSSSVVGITCTANFRELDRYGYFDVVIVDEVSKAMLPELLIPMLKAEKCILIGDHRQLPPLFNQREPLTMEEIMQRDWEDESIPVDVKISPESFSTYKELVEASYFKKMFQNAPQELKASLFTQYRMHPEIMRVDNVFYDGKLKSGFAEPEDQIRQHHQVRAKVPYLWKDHHSYWVDSTHSPDGHFFREYQAGTSKTNPLEVALIVQAMQDLDAGLDGTGQKKSVGIISFYYYQKKLLRRELRKYQFRNLEYKVETVDRFQGQEKDYILVSMTRNVHIRPGSRRSQSAYVAQFERINVAFSRARELLMVFGAAKMFEDYEISLESLIHPGSIKKLKVYKQIIDYIRSQGCFIRSQEIISPELWSDIYADIVGKPALSFPGNKRKTR